VSDMTAKVWVFALVTTRGPLPSSSVSVRGHMGILMLNDRSSAISPSETGTIQYIKCSGSSLLSSSQVLPSFFLILGPCPSLLGRAGDACRSPPTITALEVSP